MSVFRRGARQPAADDAEAVVPAAARCRVLVADDDQPVLDILVAVLSREGFAVRSVSDGRAAIDAAREDPPTLAVLDWMMPHASGLDVCRALKGDPATAGITVIMLTSLGAESQISEAFACGADDYVTKPFAIAEVVAAVNRSLAVRGVD